MRCATPIDGGDAAQAVADGGADEEWLHVLWGSTFMLSDQRGDVPLGSVAGLFHEDTRHLSTFALRVAEQRPNLLTSDAVDHTSAAFFMTNRELPDVPAHSLSIQRYRSIGDGVSEVIVITNHHDRPVTVPVQLHVRADFADLFEVKDMRFRDRGDLRLEEDRDASVLLYRYEHGPFAAATRIHSTLPARLEGERFSWEVPLEPNQTWKTRIEITVGSQDEDLEPLDPEARAASMALQRWRGTNPSLDRWEREVPHVSSGSEALQSVYRKSVGDLAALRLFADHAGNEYALPAAGLPWFMAIFGRDTLITSYMSLLVGPALARGALDTLAALQGEQVNDFKDEEPGTILHEIRFGELTVLGERPHRPYYGTADATPLFLILLSEYWRVTSDAETVHRLRPNAIAALEWIDAHGDHDGDGYVEYQTRSTQGLANQGWKDSWDGVRFADGRLPEPPIATAEVQGYVFDAKHRIAEIAEHVWGDAALAGRLRAEADALAERFNADFWIDERGGYYAQALDGRKRPVDSLTSNMGHLLWSGIVPVERASVVAHQLFSPAMWTGWGVRTMSTQDAGYNPISYHCGTVWPHDNCLISAGLYRYGLREDANRIALAMVEAAGFTGHRLPEVFAGYPRAESRFPVRYPTASSPQAWATAAPFLWLRSMLGIEPREGRLVVDPLVPDAYGPIVMRGVHAFGGSFDVTGEGTTGSVEPATTTAAS